METVIAEHANAAQKSSSGKPTELLNPSQGTAGCPKALASPGKSHAAKNRAGKEFRRCQGAIVPKNSNKKITSPVMYKNNHFGKAFCEYIHSFTLCCYYYTCYSPLVMKSICLLFPSVLSTLLSEALIYFLAF